MKLSELYTTRDVKVAFTGGKELNVTYAANELTPKIETELREASNAQQVTALVLLLVKGWDLEEDGGGVVPLTQERLQTVPLVVLGLVVRAITSDVAESTRAEGNS